MDVLAASIGAGGSVTVAARLVGISARHGQASPEQLVYAGRAAGRILVSSLEPATN